jgi:hypothetical protein
MRLSVGILRLWSSEIRCAIGSWGGGVLAGYVTLTGPSGPAQGGAPAAGGRSCCLASRTGSDARTSIYQFLKSSTTQALV